MRRHIKPLRDHLTWTHKSIANSKNTLKQPDRGLRIKHHKPSKQYEKLFQKLINIIKLNFEIETIRHFTNQYLVTTPSHYNSSTSSSNSNIMSNEE